VSYPCLVLSLQLFSVGLTVCGQLCQLEIKGKFFKRVMVHTIPSSHYYSIILTLQWNSESGVGSMASSFLFLFFSFQYYEVVWSLSRILDGINAHWTEHELIGDGIRQLELDIRMLLQYFKIPADLSIPDNWKRKKQKGVDNNMPKCLRMVHIYLLPKKSFDTYFSHVHSKYSITLRLLWMGESNIRTAILL
jgi:hypothetical protein